MTPLLLLALASQAPVDPNQPQRDDVIVTARPSGQCVFTVPDRSNRDQALEAKLRTWSPDHAIRVVITRGTSQTCRNKIAFKLAERGFKLISYVEPPHDLPSSAPPPPSYTTTTTSGTAGSANIHAAETQFTRRRAAQMIAAGQCDEALRFALSMQDLDAAAEVSSICKTLGNAPAKKRTP